MICPLPRAVECPLQRAPTRRKHAGGASGSTARCRTGWSTSCGWRRSPRSRRPTPICASTHLRLQRPVQQRPVQPLARGADSGLRGAGRRRSGPDSVRGGGAGGGPRQHGELRHSPYAGGQAARAGHLGGDPRRCPPAPGRPPPDGAARPASGSMPPPVSPSRRAWSTRPPDTFGWREPTCHPCGRGASCGRRRGGRAARAPPSRRPRPATGDRSRVKTERTDHVSATRAEDRVDMPGPRLYHPGHRTHLVPDVAFPGRARV